MLRRLPRAEQNTIVPSANRVPINRPQSLAVTMEDCGTDLPKEFLAAGKRYHFFWVFTQNVMSCDCIGDFSPKFNR